MTWNPRYKLDPDLPEPALGPGVSRPLPKEQTRDYRLVVTCKGAPPMRVVIKAATKRKAITYCQNRWPSAEVVFHEAA